MAADLSEAAAWCAEYFCRARCAGLEVRVIGAVARAAVRLGADERQLHGAAPAFGDDAAYLDALADLRGQLRQRAAALERVREQAARRAVMAQRAMRAAAAGGDMAGCASAQRALSEAVAVMETAEGAGQACGDAARLLAEAGADFCQAYEFAETTVSAGHVLPHDGRWISGAEGAAR